MQESTVEGFPLSPPQQHLWRIAERSAFPWNVGLRVRIEGQLPAEALQGALGELASEHEILRTELKKLPASSVGVQVIGADGSFELERHDLRTGSGDREAAVVALFDELLARPFHALHAPEPLALRAALVQLDQNQAELLVVQPSSCADGDSLWNLVRMAADRIAGRSPQAGVGDADEDEGPMHYADLAEWLREMFESEEAPEGLGFWRRVDLERVAASRISLELPDSPAGTFEPRRLPVDLNLEDLRQLARGSDVSVSALLLAAWQALLARHSERPDVPLAVASPGRSFEGLEDALGLFQRFLPIALTPRENESLLAFARRLDAALEQALEWHELWDLERMRSGDRPAFLPFAFEHVPAREPVEANGARLSAIAQRGHVDRFRLKLRCDESARGAELTLEHDLQSLDAQGAAVLTEQLATLLANAIAGGDSPITELGLSSPAELERLRGELAGRDPDAANDAGAAALELVHERIVARALADPRAVATVGPDGRLSYGELEARANRLARYLVAQGVGRGDFIGIAMGRSVDWSVAILAVLKAGAAYLPLPPNYPPERIAFMLADTSAPLVLTRRIDHDLVSGSQARIAVLDELELGEFDEAPLDSPAGPDDPSYVIFTSGSTGKPKGVPIRHRNLAFSTEARQAVYERPLEAYLLLSSFAFDSSIVGVFWSLCSGAKLVLPDEGQETDLAAVADLIEHEAVTHTLALPSLWSVVLDEIPAQRLRSLRTVLVAGESCPKELIARHFEKLPSCELFNEYGPTEGTVWCTAHDCSVPSRRALVPIGRPIPGAEIYVLDPQSRLAPIGVAGEIHLGGPGVAPGYLARPELSAERFVEQELQVGRPIRLYRTGDLGRFLADGTLEFLGRVDHQVKIRGYRIELGEIEAVLGRHAAVQEVVAHAHEDSTGDKRLVAYVRRSKEGTGTSVQELRGFLSGPLPEYMVPTHFVFLEELPRLPNGKVDRNALPAPSQSASPRASYVAPRTPLEAILAELWAEVLDLDQVGLNDDFFALGGHSILATRLFARIVDTLQVRIPLRTLFEKRTVEGLAVTMLEDAGDRPRLERMAELLLEELSGEEEEDGGACTR